MALKINNPPDEFDHIFMMEQSIFQTKIKHSEDSPKFSISIAWIRYKIDPNTGDIEYNHDTVETFYEEDYYTFALQKYGAGDDCCVKAHLAQQAALAAIVTEQTSYQLEII